MTQPSLPAKHEPFLCSWSGGKDSCLALYRAKEAGARPAHLLTMLNDEGVRSRSHGLTREVLKAQADSLGLCMTVGETTWDNYEKTFVSCLETIRADGITAAVFGDIDFPPHLEWEEKVCASAGMTPYLPIWNSDPSDLLREFLRDGFKAMIITVRKEKLGAEWLGRILEENMIPEFEQVGVDPCGENGEYHTVVIDGPLFKQPLALKQGDIVTRADCLSLDVRCGAGENKR